MIEELIIQRIDVLIEGGEEVLGTRHSPSPGVVDTRGDYVSDEVFYPWQASCLSLLARVFGKDSEHYRLFHEGCESGYYHDAVRGQSVLKAAKEDVEGGYLKSLESLVSADVFSNFIDMAEHLLEQGYKDPAASLVGAVLEDGLRKIAKNNAVALKSTDNISSLNQKLVQAEIYNRLVFKQINTWNELRNQADHGNFGQYSSDNVADMLDWVRGFLADHL